MGFVRGVAIAVLLLVGGCSGDGDRVASVTAPEATTAEEAATSPETPTEPTDTQAVEEPEEQVLTHAQFIRRLDRICRRGNRQIDRARERIDAAFTRGDYGEAARLWSRSEKRLNPPFYRAVESLAVPEEDRRDFERYLELSRQLDVIGQRYIRALRRNDEEEFARLDGISRRLANQRTLVTTRLGLVECGS